MGWHSGRIELSLIKEACAERGRKAQKIGGDVALSGAEQTLKQAENKHSHQKFEILPSKSMWEDNKSGFHGSEAKLAFRAALFH